MDISVPRWVARRPVRSLRTVAQTEVAWSSGVAAQVVQHLWDQRLPRIMLAARTPDRHYHIDIALPALQVAGRPVVLEIVDDYHLSVNGWRPFGRWIVRQRLLCAYGYHVVPIAAPAFEAAADKLQFLRRALALCSPAGAATAAAAPPRRFVRGLHAGVSGAQWGSESDSESGAGSDTESGDEDTGGVDVLPGSAGRDSAVAAAQEAGSDSAGAEPAFRPALRDVARSTLFAPLTTASWHAPIGAGGVGVCSMATVARHVAFPVEGSAFWVSSAASNASSQQRRQQAQRDVWLQVSGQRPHDDAAFDAANRPV